MHDGRAIANFVLEYNAVLGASKTNLELQKILYFSHAWFLIITGKPLIKHDFEAWEFGPVLPYVYREFKNFGGDAIRGRAMRLENKSGKKVAASCELEPADEEVLKQIVGFYSHLSASQLVELSHVEGGPWYNVWNHETKTNPGMRISNKEIVGYYASTKSPFFVQ